MKKQSKKSLINEKRERMKGKNHENRSRKIQEQWDWESNQGKLVDLSSKDNSNSKIDTDTDDKIMAEESDKIIKLLQKAKLNMKTLKRHGTKEFLLNILHRRWDHK